MATQDKADFPFFFHVLHAIERVYGALSIHPDDPVLSPALFPWADTLRASWAPIRDEFLAIQRSGEPIPAFQEISPEQAVLTQDQRWKTLVLHAYGHPLQRNLEKFPTTAAVLRQIPGLKTALFSILDGPTELPDHRGPYKGLLRVHLGLIVPEQCGIEVAGQTLHWRPGELLIFDDTRRHRAWNRSDEQRVVLFLDILRPLRAPLSWLNEGLIRLIMSSPFGQRSIARFEEWYERRVVP